MNKTALIAMSGGVDSAVAAYLTKEAGYKCAGANMRLFDKSGTDYMADANDAKSICDNLGIDFHVFDLRDEFKKCVIDRFICSYENCKTPNPCIDCNKHMKFGKFMELASELSMEYTVTGHYACIKNENDRYFLKKAVDSSKDQTYFLYSLTQNQLAKILFPLGGLTKDLIREIAAEHDFINAKKRDSQDICFVPGGDYVKVICELNNKTYPKGNFVNKEGKVIGIHNGIINYTVGQRKGLGTGFGERVYVCEKRLETNEVVLGKNEDLFSKSLDAVDFNWIACDVPTDKIRANVKIRYGSKEDPATVFVTGKTSVHIEFDSPQRAVASGQAAVLYDGDIVIGGGTIV